MGEISSAQKIMIAVVAVFAMGFFMVGSNKEQSDGDRKSAAMIRDRANMNRIAGSKCPKLIKKHTGTSITSLVDNTKTDNSTYLTYEYKGEAGDNFKNASCTLSILEAGGFGISDLVIDGKDLIDRK